LLAVAVALAAIDLTAIGARIKAQTPGVRPAEEPRSVAVSGEGAASPHAKDAGAFVHSNSTAEADSRLAATLVTELPEFKKARWVRVDRDIKLFPLRLATLRAGKMLLVPEARLRSAVLVLLDPAKIDPQQYVYAATHAGLRKYGAPVDIDDSIRIDLLLVGSIAINPETGARCRKHGSFEGLEYRLLRQMGAIDEHTPIVTMVHDHQLAIEDLDQEGLSCNEVPVDVICTPSRRIHIKRSLQKSPEPLGEEPSAEMEPAMMLSMLKGIAVGEKQPDMDLRKQIIQAAQDAMQATHRSKEEDSALIAAQVEQLPEFKSAEVVHLVPGSAQKLLGVAALRSGKKVVARRRALHALSVLDPSSIDPSDYEHAVSGSRGPELFGKLVTKRTPIVVDLVVLGAVAVDPASGSRVGKDLLDDLEYAVLRDMNFVSDATPVVVTARESQLLELPSEVKLAEDVPVDIVCTPTRVLRMESPLPKPTGVYWHRVSPTAMRSVQMLQKVKADLEADRGLRLPEAGGESVLSRHKHGKPRRAKTINVGEIDDFGAWAKAIRNRVSGRSTRSPRAKFSNIGRVVAELERLPEFVRAKVVRVKNGAMHRSLRLAVLKAGKQLLVPRGALSAFTLLDPATLKKGQDLREAADDRYLVKSGTKLDLDANITVDLFLIGSVVVDPVTGARLGPAGGLEELEYDVLRELRFISGTTPVVTHALQSQLLDLSEQQEHLSVPADVIVMPNLAIRIERASPRPASAIKWEEISEQKMKQLQLLQNLKKKMLKAGPSPAPSHKDQASREQPSSNQPKKDKAAETKAINEFKAWKVQVRKTMRRQGFSRMDYKAVQAADEQLRILPEFKAAKVVRAKVGPLFNSVRYAVLMSGKKLLVCRRDMHDFIMVDPAKLHPSIYAYAATDDGVELYGKFLDVHSNVSVDLIVVGALAVDPATGARLGPLGSMEEIEYGILHDMHAVSDETPVVAIVRESQLIDMSSHKDFIADLPVDIICTDRRAIRVGKPLRKPMEMIWWDRISPSRLRSFRMLEMLKAKLESDGHVLPAVGSSAQRARSGKGGRPAAAAPSVDSGPQEDAMLAISRKRAAHGAAIREVRSRIHEQLAEGHVLTGPDFELAAMQVKQLPEFQRAKVVRVLPFWRGFRIRLAALRAGKTVVVAHPVTHTLNVLDPAKINQTEHLFAATEDGIAHFGEPLGLDHNISVDLFVVGSVAVNPSTGCRLAAFGQLEELEYAALRELKALGDDVPVVTSVLDYQLVDDIPSSHVECDLVPADIICTPRYPIRVQRTLPKPEGIAWETVTDDDARLFNIVEPLRARHHAGSRSGTGAGWRAKRGRTAGSSSKGKAASVSEGFGAAVERVRQLKEFKNSKWVRVGSEEALMPLRLAALRAGKMLVVPHRHSRTSMLTLLDPTKIDASEQALAVTDAGMDRLGEPVDFDARFKLDLFVVESMPVDPVSGERCGHRLSKSCMEFGLLWRTGAIDNHTLVVAPVTEAQLIDGSDPEEACDDVRADIICTPTRTLRTERPSSEAAVAATGGCFPQVSPVAESLQKMVAELESAAKRGHHDRRVWRRALRKRVRGLMRHRKHSADKRDRQITARLVALPEYASARVVRINQGVGQMRMRLAVLDAGKTLLVPEPELRSLRIVDPSSMDPEQYPVAATLEGLRKHGRAWNASAGLKIDLFVIGAVAVNPTTGARLGPYGGFEDLEYGMLREAKAIDEDTPVATGVADFQLFDSVGEARAMPYHVPVDIILTPSATFRANKTAQPKPHGVHWHKLSERRLRTMPALRELKSRLEAERGLALPSAPEEDAAS